LMERLGKETEFRNAEKKWDTQLKDLSALHQSLLSTLLSDGTQQQQRVATALATQARAAHTQQQAFQAVHAQLFPLATAPAAPSGEATAAVPKTSGWDIAKIVVPVGLAGYALYRYLKRRQII